MGIRACFFHIVSLHGKSSKSLLLLLHLSLILLGATLAHNHIVHHSNGVLTSG